MSNSMKLIWSSTFRRTDIGFTDLELQFRKSFRKWVSSNLFLTLRETESCFLHCSNLKSTTSLPIIT